jgi:3-deoxy-manno-octulosonate cytidylyltransferase (CMP-KDO synthetase)
MNEPNYVVIIPARYGSSRLEGKPLINLCGVPMIVRTYRQCIKVCPQKMFT